MIGSTEHQVTVLTELDPDELTADLVLVPGEVDSDDAGDEETTIPVIVPPTPITTSTSTSTSTVQRGGARKAVTPRAGVRKAAPARAGARRAAPVQAPSNGALAGSVLSPQTWKQALAAATGKAS